MVVGAGRSNETTRVHHAHRRRGGVAARGAGAAAGGRQRRYAAELVALAPDIILAGGTVSVAAVQQASRSLPIVFASVADPVGAGFVDSLARPGGNATGFMNFEYSFSGKWLELLKEVAPAVKRAAVLRDAANPLGIGQFTAIQTVAPSLGVEVSAINVRDAGEIERSIAAFARSPNIGLVVTPSAEATVHRDLIITLAARHKLPAVYGDRFCRLRCLRAPTRLLNEAPRVHHADSAARRHGRSVPT
jgi:putative ABC transport system substrate-binding protein